MQYIYVSLPSPPRCFPMFLVVGHSSGDSVLARGLPSIVGSNARCIPRRWHARSDTIDGFLRNMRDPIGFRSSWSRCRGAIERRRCCGSPNGPRAQHGNELLCHWFATIHVLYLRALLASFLQDAASVDASLPAPLGQTLIP